MQAIPLPHRGLLTLSGADVRPFLQGLVTSDVLKLSPGQSQYALMLTPQGKYLFDFFLMDDGEGNILLDAPLERLEELRKKLTMYKLRSQVVIENAAAQWAVYAEITPHSPEPEGTTLMQADGVIKVLDPREKRMGYRLYIPHQGVEAATQGWQLLPVEAYDNQRIHYALPEAPNELIVDKSYPLEWGMDALHAISFTKGCYVGQEVTARTKHRGVVRKAPYIIRPVDSGTPLRPHGVVMADGKEAGLLCSVAPNANEGLGLLRIEEANAAERLTVHGIPISFTPPARS